MNSLANNITTDNKRITAIMETDMLMTRDMASSMKTSTQTVNNNHISRDGLNRNKAADARMRGARCKRRTKGTARRLQVQMDTDKITGMKGDSTIKSPSMPNQILRTADITSKATDRISTWVLQLPHIDRTRCDKTKNGKSLSLRWIGHD